MVQPTESSRLKRRSILRGGRLRSSSSSTSFSREVKVRRVPSGDQASSPKPSSRSASVTTSPGIDTGSDVERALALPVLVLGPPAGERQAAAVR